jgi:hypothetical protein
MGHRFSMNTRSKTQIHPAITPVEHTSSFTTPLTRPGREYMTDGSILVRTPAPVRGPGGSVTIVFVDGSYIIGKINAQTKNIEGYCEYRDIANRLIYTGYMYENSYNGWGSIWDESGSWPEYTTYWSVSRPANRVLHSTPNIMEWDYTLDGTKREDFKDKHRPLDKPHIIGSRVIFNKVRESFAHHKNGSSEPLFQEMIRLYINIRENPRHTPPSPNIGPMSRNPLDNSGYHQNPTFLAITPPKSPKDLKLNVVSNPLRVRIPPETSKMSVEYG